MPLTCLVGTVVVVVVVLTGLTGGCVVVVVGANVLDAAGSLVVSRNAVTPCDGGLARVVGVVVPVALGRFLVPLFVCVGGAAELVDDVVDVTNGALVVPGAVETPGDGEPSPSDKRGVVDPLAIVGLGAVGDEPGSSAKDARSATMPKTDAIPMPPWRDLMFISRLNLRVDRPLHTVGLEQLLLSCTRVRPRLHVGPRISRTPASTSPDACQPPFHSLRPPTFLAQRRSRVPAGR